MRNGVTARLEINQSDTVLELLWFFIPLHTIFTSERAALQTHAICRYAEPIGFETFASLAT